jgi:NADPH:quinone reductase-like Zn-dependent oxidoreductase
VDLVKSLGADTVVDYQTEDYTKTENKFHFIFDAVGKISFGQWFWHIFRSIKKWVIKLYKIYL